jgi:hypothetical protein
MACAAMANSDGDAFDGAWWYAYGQVGCLWDGDPSGPFASYDEAAEAAQDY